ncbi:MAG: hypothetical protein M9962_13020 [Oligoflexia bacterium]|nr:hypothetical protein [Oligoflexia bacterium]
MTILKTLLIALVATYSSMTLASSRDLEVDKLKEEILSLAKSYEGQGDPDQSKQKSLDKLVNKLLALKPMPPASERISLIIGTWRQVWGPYEYRKDDGSVDPELGVNEIYQVVFKDGFYYNVAPFYKNGNRSQEKIGLLRGEYQLVTEAKNALSVKFTDYPGVEPRPSNYNLWELPVMAENNTLENRITILPSWIVRAFFKGGTLDEVYTDEDLRITYGKSNKPSARRSLYILSRVK